METLELKNVTTDVKDFNRWLNTKLNTAEEGL